MPSKETIIKISQRQVETCLEFRQPRMDEIKRSEDAYLGKTKPALKGRFNIPLPIVEGFVETLMSKIDDTIKVDFKKGRESTLKASKKITSAWEKDSAPDRGAYNEADLDAKKLAIFSGFGALKLIPSSNPYFQKLSAIDYYDFIFEPYGGKNIDEHLFKGQLNIFKSKQELIDGAKAGIYDSTQVQILISQTTEQRKVLVQEQRKNKLNRFLAIGINPENYSYVGSDILNLTELITRVEGKDYYVLFDQEIGHWIRIKPLKEIYKSELSPYIVWHTERNPTNFLCRAPVDGIRPVAEALRILVNQNFDNIQKRNWDMIFYNAKKIINPAQLEYRPHGVISVRLKDGESMDSAYAKMETPDTTNITLNLAQWLTNLMGEKTGVTSGQAGIAEEDKVGIYFGNIQQAADRFGLLNKFYTQAHINIAKRYKANLSQFMPPRKFMVRFIGLSGLQEEELKREEVDSELEIQVTSVNTEAKISEVANTKRLNALDRFLKDPELKIQVSP